MKSPTSSVGRIEELGILNGSATKDRSRNTISSTGKKLFGYSIHHGSGTSPRRRPSFLADLQDREESFLWDLDAADRLHALLTGLLLLEQFALARDIAAVALRQR